MDALYSFIAYFSPGFVAWLQASRYILLFLGAIFEGPLLMVTSGFLYRVGALDLIPMYVALVSGDFVADIGWYFVGRFGGRPMIAKFGHHFGITEESVAKIQERFHKYHEKILIISKLTMGFGFALVTLVVAGMLHTPFKKYVILNLVGGFVWTAMLLLVGYFFGNIYVSITGPEKFLFIGSALLGVIAILKIANKNLSKQSF